ncbi:flavocytochrome c [Ferrimonas senticii]|uniref:flavocytochrome c n=1 Tax=Ferrimonas senticii TaxID=394566 RepID=UPI000404E9CF|nr:flavocytochrome c [Ferrimonas senticii]
MTSRRNFLKGSAATLLTAGLASGAHANGRSASYDEQFDIIIIGSGFAGCAAAVEATKAGKKTLLIDKMPGFGGNSCINGGAMAVVGSPQQARKGIEDSIELMIADMLKAGRNLGDPELVKLVANESAASYEFLLQCGTKFKDTLMHFGGHTQPRIIQSINAVGGDMTTAMLKTATANGLDARKNCHLDQIIVAQDGAIEGIEIRQNYYFEQPSSGQPLRIKVNQALIMATGGFAADVEFRQAQVPALGDHMSTTNHQGGSASGLKAMIKIGAWPVQLSQIQIGPWTSPDEYGFGHTPFNSVGTFPYGLTVDVRSGKRFFNEMADRKERADAILAQLDEQGKPVYPVAFVSQSAVDKYRGSFYILESGLHAGVIKKFATIAELAQHYGMPVAGLTEQVQQFEADIKRGQDSQFARHNLKAVPPLGTGPFYAIRLWPKAHYTMGGVKINKEAQVINMQTSQPIAKLYAAGEVTGGIHGGTRLGGCAIAEAIATGRRAVIHCLTQA